MHLFHHSDARPTSIHTHTLLEELLKEPDSSPSGTRRQLMLFQKPSKEFLWEIQSFHVEAPVVIRSLSRQAYGPPVCWNTTINSHNAPSGIEGYRPFLLCLEHYRS